MSKKTPETGWQKLKNAFLNEQSEKAIAMMDDMDPDEFMVNFFKLAEYVAPKLARVEQVSDEGTEINLNINYVKSEADEEEQKGTDN
jgi:hypothetical protein